MNHQKLSSSIRDIRDSCDSETLSRLSHRSTTGSPPQRAMGSSNTVNVYRKLSAYNRAMIRKRVTPPDLSIGKSAEV